MSLDKNQAPERSSTAVVVDGIEYTAVATAVTSDLSKPAPFLRGVAPEFAHIPEAQNLRWEDDFFDDEDVVAVFDFDYELMESYYSNVGWVCYGATLVYPPLFWICTLGLAPCYLRQNVRWNVTAQHVAITRDGIRFVRDRRRTCWGWPCTDAGRSSKTVPFDKITDCDIEEPAGNTCLCIRNVLSTVNVDTASSGNGGRHELQISGLRDPHSFKKLVWAMKRARESGLMEPPAAAARAFMERGSGTPHEQQEDVSTLLREIRDELRQHNTLLKGMKTDGASAGPSAPSDQEIV